VLKMVSIIVFASHEFKKLFDSFAGAGRPAFSFQLSALSFQLSALSS